jgi:hypothetical protein
LYFEGEHRTESVLNTWFTYKKELAVLGKKTSIFISRMLLLDTDLAVTSSLSKREGGYSLSSWGAMGTILLRRALL